jgi:hypothetical protein
VTNYAQLVNSIVVNVIVADADFVAQSELNYVLLTRGGIDWTYDSTNNVFIAPQPHPSWTLDSNHDWQPPTPRPDDGKMYKWNEAQLEWVLIQ